MRLDQALARIQQTGQTVMRTADVMGLLDVNKDHASQILSRLAGSGHLLRLKRGTWLIARTRDPLPLVGYLTAPLPSYISLQTALYHHGMISQMPTVIYCVSLTRTRVYATPGHEFGRPYRLPGPGRGNLADKSNPHCPTQVAGARRSTVMRCPSFRAASWIRA